MRVSLALLRRSQEKLLSMSEFEDIIGFLSLHLYDSFDNPTELIQDAMSLKQTITKQRLESLAQKYSFEGDANRKSAKKSMLGWRWMLKEQRVKMSSPASSRPAGSIENMPTDAATNPTSEPNA
ncbi:hypothetical protein K493DRAFT_39791 [Basidiobolus meristosporus CBS 931.73]|uniref:Uncharacterized protein n=1 Tax=Basidiobolus meristosporus CBS 931.73 TaxID=1314790 RepID=A0A1Y1Y4N7_9FUNG|nr:hypothetical protein K493DRAFT_39791 [Basidiobolus meristosporus CBS 931.73]|eukprot:ORX92919.1 hypothetical protein K493DRAFT_39791 [Basidiobolus meristosporus CBS 931.73]